MKQTLLIAAMALMMLPGWADNLVTCPADNPNCHVGANVGSMTPEQLQTYIEQLKQENEATKADRAKEDSEKQQWRAMLPQLQEFYVPLNWSTTVAGALFGSIGRQKKQIAEYWQARQSQLDSENQQCLTLQENDYIRECLNNVRQTEARKSEQVAQMNQAQTQATYATSAYMMQAAQNASRQYQQSRPVNVNCNSYGYGNMVNTNCTGY